ncbi:MAG TPA: sugar phosphate nucleotidyltransferase, partial [Stenomitos sp.]
MLRSEGLRNEWRRFAGLRAHAPYNGVRSFPMKAVLMAGGSGTRLRPLTCDIPKPMVPMLNKPMAEHIINLLKRHGITDII